MTGGTAQGGDQLLDFRTILSPHNAAGVLDFILLFMLCNRWIGVAQGSEGAMYSPYGLFNNETGVADLLASSMGANAATLAINATYALWVVGIILFCVDAVRHFFFKRDTGRVLPALLALIGVAIWVIWHVTNSQLTGGVTTGLSPVPALYVIFCLLLWGCCGPAGKRAMDSFLRDADETREVEL